MMGDMTGMDFHQRLAARSPELAQRIVFMTGGVFTDAARDFLAGIPNACVEKPFDLKALRALVALRAPLGERGAERGVSLPEKLGRRSPLGVKTSGESASLDPSAETSAEKSGRARLPSGTLPALRALPRLVWLLGLASFFNDISSEAIFPLLPLFLAQLGAPMRYIGLIEGSADALASIIKMIAGRLSDRGPRRLMVTGGYALPALARAGIALAAAPFHVLAARLVDRTGKGIRSGPRDAMIADSVRPMERGRAFGLNRSLDHLGAAVGPLIASALIALGASLRVTFVVAAALGLVAPVILFLRLRDPAHIARADTRRAASARCCGRGTRSTSRSA
jgi:CheY-like chemotaxis protein